MVTASVISRDVKEAISGLTEEGRKLYERIHEKLNRLTQLDLLTRYDVGAYIKAAEADERKYGEGFVQRIATIENCAADDLYKFQALANTWTRQQIKELADRETLRGTRLSYTHLYWLSTISDVKDRQKLLEKCFSQGLTTRDLQAQIMELRGKKSQGGRPRVAPRSPQAGLATLRKYAQQILSHRDLFDEAIFDRLSDAPTEVASDGLLEEIAAAETELQELEKLIHIDRQKLSAARDTVTRALSAKQQAAEPQSAAGQKRVVKVPPRNIPRPAAAAKPAAKGQAVRRPATNGGPRPEAVQAAKRKAATRRPAAAGA